MQLPALQVEKKVSRFRKVSTLIFSRLLGISRLNLDTESMILTLQSSVFLLSCRWQLTE